MAITRAIGDTDLKPYITSEPEIVSFELDGDEDFVIMASDGLWDGVSDDGAASEVYNRLKEDPGKFCRLIYAGLRRIVIWKNELIVNEDLRWLVAILLQCR